MSTIDKASLRVLNLISQHQLATLDRSLSDWGCITWKLDGSTVTDAATLFVRAAVDLPSPFTVRPVHGWDAFKDSLWEAAVTCDADEIAFVWTNTQRMLEGGLADLLQAAATLGSLSRDLAKLASPSVSAKTFYIFLAGTGPNFPDLPTSDKD